MLNIPEQMPVYKCDIKTPVKFGELPFMILTAKNANEVLKLFVELFDKNPERIEPLENVFAVGMPRRIL